MEFGVSKCKLLVTARPKKLKEVEQLLSTGILTFYDKPVSLVNESYTHIGVPQAPRKQPRLVTDYRISKGDDISYMLQHSPKNALRGISPISNRKMFICSFQPSYLYGLDTLNMNKGDLERLETSYRSVIKHMLAVLSTTIWCFIAVNLVGEVVLLGKQLKSTPCPTQHNT